MSLPNKVYYVTKTGGERLTYGQRGGGLFALLQGAKDRANTIARRTGAEMRVYEGTVTWTEVTDE